MQETSQGIWKNTQTCVAQREWVRKKPAGNEVREGLISYDKEFCGKVLGDFD